MSGEIKYSVISVRQGDSFIINIELKNGCKPVNLEGAELRMDVRKNKNLIFSLIHIINYHFIIINKLSKNI